MVELPRGRNPGRALRPEEAREVMNIARRIAAIILLQPQLDQNYNTIKAAAFDWPRNREMVAGYA